MVLEADAGSALPPGTPVFGFTDWSSWPEIRGRQGSYAELLTIPEAHLARMPRAAGFVEAAALPLVACTAWQVRGLTAGPCL